ncbi:MAG: type II secretion system protein M [Betaproteobacteria bacterium]|nr:type II secretion system protein M [Betaproteobacteria bacterium]
MNAPAFWTARNARERSVIAWAGAAVALLLLAVFAWLPLERARSRIGADLPALRASVAQMRAQADEVKALRTLPARSGATAVALGTLVASGTLAQGLPGARLSAIDAKRVRLAVDDASWTRLVEWLSSASAAHGLSVDEATIEALPSTGRVRATLVLAAP